MSWDLQQPSSAILSAILQHLSGISSRSAQTRAASVVVASGSDESMDHDWALSVGLDPTLTLTSATGNISQFTTDAYVRSHVVLMLRLAAELVMQAMVSLAPKIAQMGVYNRELYAPDFSNLFLHILLELSSLFVHFPSNWSNSLTAIRYENSLLLALAEKHTQFKEHAGLSLASMGTLDFATALQEAHSARALARQITDEASKGFPAQMLHFHSSAQPSLTFVAPQFLGAANRAARRRRCVPAWAAPLGHAGLTVALTGCWQHQRWYLCSGPSRCTSLDPL